RRMRSFLKMCRLAWFPLLSLFTLRFWFCSLSMLSGRSASCHCSRVAGTASHQAGPAIDHFLQLILIAGTGHGDFQGNLLLEVQRCQRLIERLHSEFVLA